MPVTSPDVIDWAKQAMPATASNPSLASWKNNLLDIGLHCPVGVPGYEQEAKSVPKDRSKHRGRSQRRADSENEMVLIWRSNDLKAYW